MMPLLTSHHGSASKQTDTVVAAEMPLPSIAIWQHGRMTTSTYMRALCTWQSKGINSMSSPAEQFDSHTVVPWIGKGAGIP